MKKLTLELRSVPVSKIEPNPKNPRGENVRDNDKQFDYLKRSIKQFGLIVPLIVEEIDGRGNKYRLIDGERRFYALKELGIKEAAAHVITDGVDENAAKNVMFHIHTNRIQWNACQQCKALEPTYRSLKRKLGDDENKIAKELVRLTSTHKRTINSRLNFLRWPDPIKDYVYQKKPELYWTVVEIEGGIITPAAKNFPEYFEKVAKDEVRELLFKKYLEGVVHAGTEVRRVKYVVRTTKDKPKQHQYAARLLKRLVEELSYTFEEAEESFLAKFPDAAYDDSVSYRKVYNQVVKLATMLTEFNVGLFKTTGETQITDLEEALEELESAVAAFKEQAQEYLTGI